MVTGRAPAPYLSRAEAEDAASHSVTLIMHPLSSAKQMDPALTALQS